MGKNSRYEDEVQSISDVSESHTDQMRSRMIKYSVSMVIRLICFVLVFVVEGWLQWVMIAGAVFLPYFAVILANGGSDTSEIRHSEALLNGAPVPALESAPAPDAAGIRDEEDNPATERPTGRPEAQVLDGEVLPDEASPAPQRTESRE